MFVVLSTSDKSPRFGSPYPSYGSEGDNESVYFRNSQTCPDFFRQKSIKENIAVVITGDL